MKTRVLTILALIMFVFIITGCDSDKKTASKDIKVGFVYVGPTDDGGWTFAHDKGRKHLESLGVKTSYVEKVNEADGFRAIRNLARDNDLVFTTSFGFMDPTLRAAKEDPDTIFMHLGGFKTAKNMGTYFGRMYQAKYLAGMVAGSMTKSNIIGAVGSHPISEIIRHIDAFALGVQAVNPKAKVQVVWINQWFDPPKEISAANTLMDSGADVIMSTVDSPASLQAAKKRGCYGIGNDNDQSEFVGENHLTAAMWDWGVYYEDLYNRVKNGTWKPQQDWWGIETGLVKLAPFSPLVPDSVRKKVEEEKKALSEGKKVFQGPIYNQKGELAVADGQSLSDHQMLTIDYFVKGVIGNLPKGAAHE